MATSKTLTPTNVTISIPAMTDRPDASGFSDCVDKEADAINALNSKVAYYVRKVENVVITFTDGIGYYDITSLGLSSTPLFSVVGNNTDVNIGVIINTDIANSTSTSLKMIGKSVNVSGTVTKLSGSVRLIITVYGG